MVTNMVFAIVDEMQKVFTTHRDIEKLPNNK